MGVEKPIMVVASTGAILAMIACLVAIPSLYREINEIHDMWVSLHCFLPPRYGLYQTERYRYVRGVELEFLEDNDKTVSSSQKSEAETPMDSKAAGYDGVELLSKLIMCLSQLY
ncbi:hypothetical protein Y032_0722g1829 [Ancylostoma ceylanicum]|uniref:Nematode cuticle collagen N-terminal domain-containing protein n=1 Tax=Ancylostoma ceylanicum TaxID=53326 RepID=A0A016WFE0_9BILA|nr:hypothetical protein Y032_0722g1829 [Ancylostoma ceylanicum]